MKSEINSTFDELDTNLARFQKTRRLRDVNEAYIVKAFRWLAIHQHQDGYWGDGSILDTLTSLQALAAWNVGRHNWNILFGEGANGIDRAFSWLGTYGSRLWENNIWEAALAMRIAHIFDTQDTIWYRETRNWLIEQEENLWGLDRGLPAHYVAQAVMAMTVFKAPESTLAHARVAMLTAAEDSLRSGSPMTPYIAGQVVEALVISGTGYNDTLLSHFNLHLKDYLLKIEVSISNWLNICTAARAISLARGNKEMHEPAIEIRLNQIFNQNRVRENGSWYNNVHYTSYALLALESMQSVRKIEGDVFDIYRETFKSRNALLLLSDKRDKRFLFSFGIGIVAGLLIATGAIMLILYLLSSPSVITDGNVIFYIAPLLLTLAGAIMLRYLPVRKWLQSIVNGR